MEAKILLWIQEHMRNDIMTIFWKGITFLGNKGLIWIVLSIVLIFMKKTRKVGIMSIIALVVSMIVTNMVLKNLVTRIRPFDAIEGLISLDGRPSGYSFPSGHTSAAFSTGVVYLMKLPKRYGLIMFIYAFLMGFSRMYLGVHYLTDVIAGMIVGASVGFLVMYIFDKVNGDIRKNKELKKIK